jgi:hypothetical protein
MDFPETKDYEIFLQTVQEAWEFKASSGSPPLDLLVRLFQFGVEGKESFPRK